MDEQVKVSLTSPPATPPPHVTPPHFPMHHPTTPLSQYLSLQLLPTLLHNARAAVAQVASASGPPDGAAAPDVELSVATLNWSHPPEAGTPPAPHPPPPFFPPIALSVATLNWSHPREVPPPPHPTPTPPPFPYPTRTSSSLTAATGTWSSPQTLSTRVAASRGSSRRWGSYYARGVSCSSATRRGASAETTSSRRSRRAALREGGEAVIGGGRWRKSKWSRFGGVRIKEVRRRSSHTSSCSSVRGV